MGNSRIGDLHVSLCQGKSTRLLGALKRARIERLLSTATNPYSGPAVLDRSRSEAMLSVAEAPVEHTPYCIHIA